jgi:hypothetical protein
MPGWGKDHKKLMKRWRKLPEGRLPVRVSSLQLLRAHFLTKKVTGFFVVLQMTYIFPTKVVQPLSHLWAVPPAVKRR